MGKIMTAKVKLQGVEELHGGSVAPDRHVVLRFEPDYADGRNAAWAVATPHLQLAMTVQGHVADQLEPGASYTLSFELTDEADRSEMELRDLSEKSKEELKELARARDLPVSGTKEELLTRLDSQQMRAMEPTAQVGDTPGRTNVTGVSPADRPEAHDNTL